MTNSILKLKYTWIPVFWLGLAVAMSALYGFRLLGKKPVSDR